MRPFAQSSLRALYGCLLVCCLTIAPTAGWAVERLTFRIGEQELHLTGKVLVEAQDGGLLALAPDGQVWPIRPKELLSRASDDKPFKPLDVTELSALLKQELPDGFKIYTTKHYLICYNTSDAYAQWCGALFERLYGAFTNYWENKGSKLYDPQFPLVALVFADQASYQNHARNELGDAVQSIIGYYSFRTNRITMYDLTGAQAVRAVQRPQSKTATIQETLSHPAAERLVATVIHEATHQIAFNCGLQRRYADNPLWFSEGLAMYFETPDVRSSSGWRNLGAVNTVRLAQFQEYLPRREPGTLPALFVDDKRFRETAAMTDAYAEAWALTYFLMKRKPKQYQEYFKTIGQKPLLIWDEPEGRLADFKAAFGNDLVALEREFVQFMRGVRAR